MNKEKKKEKETTSIFKRLVDVINNSLLKEKACYAGKFNICVDLLLTGIMFASMIGGWAHSLLTDIAVFFNPEFAPYAKDSSFIIMFITVALFSAICLYVMYLISRDEECGRSSNSSGSTKG